MVVFVSLYWPVIATANGQSSFAKYMMFFVKELWPFTVTIDVLWGRGFVRYLPSVTKNLLALESRIGEAECARTDISA